MEKNIGNYAVKLSRNPLGIIALFILLVDALAGCILGFVDLDGTLQAILVCFIALFPVLTILIFAFLVIKYPGNLYAPGDFQNQDHFMEIVKSRIRSEVDNVNADALKELAKLDIELIPIWEVRTANRSEDLHKKIKALSDCVDRLEVLTENSNGSKKVASASALREVYMQYLDTARSMYGSTSDYYPIKNRIIDGLKKISNIKN